MQDEDVTFYEFIEQGIYMFMTVLKGGKYAK